MQKEYAVGQILDIGATGDIPEGEAIVVAGEDNETGKDIAVFHAEDGKFYALDDNCTHETASLAEGWIEGDRVECPLHATEFCLRTGKVMCLPATESTFTHVVEVVDGRIQLHPGESVPDAVRK